MAKRHNIIGFHGAAAGGNNHGIGDYFRKLIAKGIPPVFMGADGGGGGLDEGVHLCSEAGMDGIFVHRLSGEGNDTPEYGLEPAEAADKLRARVWNHPKTPKSLLETGKVILNQINEPRKEVKWCNWLGHCELENAKAFNGINIPYGAFAFSSGTPEYGGWATDGMLAYLEYCAANPEMAYVIVHEYSLNDHQLFNMEGELLYRFKRIFRVCDEHGITRPNIIIKEWGWGYNSLPGADAGMSQLKQAAAVYAKYPEIKGAGLWYLGPAYAGIANIAQKYIKPITQFTLETEYPAVKPGETPVILTTDPPGFAGTTNTPGSIVDDPDKPPVIINGGQPPDKPIKPTAEKTLLLQHNFALFDGRGEWYDHGNVQVADGWDERWGTGDSPLADGKAWNRLVAPEGVYLSEQMLPAAERGAFLNKVKREGVNGFTYHIFAVGPWHERQWTKKRLDAGTYQLSLWLHGDWATGGNHAQKTRDGLEDRHALAELYIGDEGKGVWLEMNLVGDNQLVKEITIDAAGEYDVGWGIYTVWANSRGPNGCFIKGFSLHQIVAPKSPPVIDEGGETDVDEIIVTTEFKQILLTKLAELEKLIRKLTVGKVSEPIDDAKDKSIDLEDLPKPPPPPLSQRKAWITIQTPLSQRDERWKLTDLDGLPDGLTIGDWFCLGIVYNMMARHLGLTTMLPAEFHAHLRSAGGMNKEAIQPHALRIAFPQHVVSDGWSLRSKDVDLELKVRAYLDAGIPVPARVDFGNPDTPGPDQHWILVMGYVAADFYAIDPWDGKQIRVREKYGDLLEGLFYRKQGVPRPKLRSKSDLEGGMRLPGEKEGKSEGESKTADKRAIIIDISHHQEGGKVPFAKLKEQGVVGVYVRMSYGTKVDKTAATHLANAKNAGMLVGVYHFLDGRKDVAAQANLFRNQIAQWGLDLPPAIDVEEVPALNIPLPTEKQVGEFARILKEVRPHALIYTSKRFYDRVGDDNFGCDLWLAAYTKLEPVLPRAWKNEGWVIWQYTTKPGFASYDKELDTNRFAGDLKALKEYLKSGKKQSKPTIKPIHRPTIKPTAQLQTGMNINPEATHSNPVHNNDLKGMDWVRFPFKAAAERRSIEKGFEAYDGIINKYAAKGVRTLLVINQETTWRKISPWSGNGSYEEYAKLMVEDMSKIARHYAHLGNKVAYEIWNEGDQKNNPAAIYISPESFAKVLGPVAKAIRQASPQSKIVLGGLLGGPEDQIEYVRRTQKALKGKLPVDAVGTHPYGRHFSAKPSGPAFGSLTDMFNKFKLAFPKLQWWITEIGVADDFPERVLDYQKIAKYYTDVHRGMENHVAQCPVVIWFAWSDEMRNAGIVKRDGSKKAHIFNAFKAVRDRQKKSTTSRPASTRGAKKPDKGERLVGMNVGHFEETWSKDDWPQLERLLASFPLIRFMDWQKINSLFSDKEKPQHYTPIGELDLDSRPLPSDDWRYAGTGAWRLFKGVPLEIIIDTANKSKARPWICLPHLATDSLMAEMVQLVLARAEQPPIFEYSNEVWNAGFKQYYDCAQLGRAHYSLAKMKQAGLQVKKDEGNRRTHFAIYWQGQRTNELAQMVRQYLGNANNPVANLQREADVVVGSQRTNPWFSEQLLKVCGDNVTAVAIAPYLGNHVNAQEKRFNAGNGSGFSQLKKQLLQEIAGPYSNPFNKKDKSGFDLVTHLQLQQEKVSRHNVELWGYEAGLHMQGKAFASFNRSPIAGEITYQLLQTWFEQGGGPICLYSLTSRFGAQQFGHVEVVRNAGRNRFEELQKLRRILG